ncbi:MAG: adenylyl-sulfate reductase subunit beta [Terriglobales bacterium]
MPALVNPDACDACAGLAEPLCVALCPADILQLDTTGRHTFNLEPDGCWECFACVKSCPAAAIAVRGSADVFPLGALLTPSRGAKAITWEIQCRSGRLAAYAFPIRTTPWGSIGPFAGVPPPTVAALHTPLLCGEPGALRPATP